MLSPSLSILSVLARGLQFQLQALQHARFVVVDARYILAFNPQQLETLLRLYKRCFISFVHCCWQEQEQWSYYFAASP